MTIMENMRYGSPFIKKGMKFKICHGYRNTARGMQKTYWLVEFVENGGK